MTCTTFDPSTYIQNVTDEHQPQCVPTLPPPVDPEAKEKGAANKSDVPGSSDTVDTRRQAAAGLSASVIAKPARSKTFMMTGSNKEY
jgi:hypothetical protein